MPNETIICNDGSKLTIQWGKADEVLDDHTPSGDPSVVLTSLKAWEDPSGETGGWDPVEAWHLDAGTIARLVPLLRRACHQAYRTTIDATLSGFFLPCTCGVMAGGVRDPRPDCPAHSATTTVSIPITVSIP